MIKNKKIFYAIGQGGFYSEKIYFGNEIKTIVYDCGSLNKERLSKEISQSGLGIIDYLVISHFHKDHINGIEELKSLYTIKNVIIPKIDTQDILFYLKDYSKKSDIGYRNLVLNPSDFFKGTNENEDPNIITVDTESEQIEIIDTKKIPNKISHKTNIPIFSNNNSPLWILRFYVDKGSFDKVKLTKTQKDLINSISSIKDYTDNLTELKKVYNGISKDNVNLTSMSMVSAPLHYERWYYENNSISIMNGDILLDKEEKIFEFTNHYSDFKQNNYNFHIPHHGSHKNLKRPINEWIINKGIIMSGYDNNYGHPSGVILRKFSDTKIPVKVLTEYDKNYIKIDHY